MVIERFVDEVSDDALLTLSNKIFPESFDDIANEASVRSSWRFALPVGVEEREVFLGGIGVDTGAVLSKTEVVCILFLVEPAPPLETLPPPKYEAIDFVLVAEACLPLLLLLLVLFLEEPLEGGVKSETGMGESGRKPRLPFPRLRMLFTLSLESPFLLALSFPLTIGSFDFEALLSRRE